MYETTTPSNIATNSLPNKACIHSYKTRLFRNKAALMILQWVFTAFLNVIIAIQFIDNYNTKYLAGAATALSGLGLQLSHYCSARNEMYGTTTMASEGASDNQSTEAHLPSTQVCCEEQVSSAEECLHLLGR